MESKSLSSQLETAHAHFKGFFETICDLEFGSREEWAYNHELLGTERF